MREVNGIAWGVALAMVALFGGACTTARTSTDSSIPTSARNGDLDRYLTDLERDLARARIREGRPAPVQAAYERAMPYSDRRAAKESVLGSLIMPVARLAPHQISDSWGAPRDGGRRKHRGIDIFAARGTEIVAVADGLVTYIGEQPKGGRCLWLTTEQGLAFYYAHLERWAPGLYEGMEVRKGEVLGFVGNTGNAISTPPHLHFSVVDGDQSVNPYPILRRSKRSTPVPLLTGGFAAGGGR